MLESCFETLIQVHRPRVGGELRVACGVFVENNVATERLFVIACFLRENNSVSLNSRALVRGHACDPLERQNLSFIHYLHVSLLYTMR